MIPYPDGFYYLRILILLQKIPLLGMKLLVKREELGKKQREKFFICFDS